MTYLRTNEHDNAGVPFFMDVYSCDRCNEEVLEAHPRYQDDGTDTHYCWYCGFIVGKIPEKEFLKHCGVHLKDMHAGVNPDGEVQFWTGNKTPPWERSNKEQRNSPKYKEWRKNVFERDEYTCQECGQVGGELNAHHIKPFAKYKKLRYEVSNGLTVCVECHRKVHKREGRNV